MRHRRNVAIVGLLLVLSVTSAPARAQITDQPGYFPIEDFNLLSPDALSVEVNLNSGLLGLVAAAMEEEDPAFAELVRGLEGIRVRIGEADDVDLEALRSGFARASDWVEENDWETLIRIREDDEELFVFTRMHEGEMVGTTVLALDPAGEIVMVNVVGRLDLALLAVLAESLDIPQLNVTGLGSGEED